MQINPNFRQVIIDNKGKRFKVNESLDAIKERWLKERTVIVVFQEEAQNLTRGVKEDLIRVCEDGWMVRRLFNPEVRRGRVTFEGANVISYVAKAPEVVARMVQKASTKLTMRDIDYPVVFKSWMLKSDVKELTNRLKEAGTYFWMVALRVPLEAFYYLASTVEALIGGVKHMHPSEVDRSRLKMMNVKFDMEPQVMYREHLGNGVPKRGDMEGGSGYSIYGVVPSVSMVLSHEGILSQVPANRSPGETVDKLAASPSERSGLVPGAPSGPRSTGSATCPEPGGETKVARNTTIGECKVMP
ncbi:hypothetical protein CBR_g51906 [Chara braunii]|uniref:Uncharacterized protein n=1 Tax=Chara braunii TaxID=69332 RepID=A0A388M9E6_CHABU|nr:hypothetical protein CBR_g51906 [Chara braunii]|eukprot:GBG91103.1 hypothetical protein CBR_g51906 [Chara braunii]